MGFGALIVIINLKQITYCYKKIMDDNNDKDDFSIIRKILIRYGKLAISLNIADQFFEIIISHLSKFRSLAIYRRIQTELSMIIDNNDDKMIFNLGWWV